MQDTSRPQRRRDPAYTKGTVVLIAFLLFMVAVCGVISYAATVALIKQPKTKSVEYTPTVEPLGMIFEKDGSATDVYVFTDPDTDIQYLITQDGAICQRQDVDIHDGYTPETEEEIQY